MDTDAPLNSNITTGSLINSRGSELLLDLKNNNLFSTKIPDGEQTYSGYVPPDSTWIRQAFMVPTVSGNILVSSLSAQDKLNRTFSSATLKFTDSSIGGNTVINPLPQYTPYCDVREPGILLDTGPVTTLPPTGYSNQGMGGYYSEAIDDNNQVIHLRFGLPVFNSLTQFFTGMYSGDLAAAARAGRLTDNIVQSFFQAAGNAVGFAISPLFIVPLGIMFLAKAANFFLGAPTSKFYSLKPSMPTYWNAVNNLVNQLAVNSGLSSYVDTKQSTVLTRGTDGQDLQQSQVINVVGKFLPPGLIRNDGTIDVYAIANRAARMSIQHDTLLAKAFEDASQTDSYFDILRNYAKYSKTNPYPKASPNLASYLDRFWNFAAYNKAQNTNDSVEKDPRINSNPDIKGAYQNSSPPGLVDYLIANWNDGGEFVSFRVDYTGSISESFSNSVAESSLQSKINSMSSANRETRFSVADGNVGFGVGAVVDAIKGFTSGVAEIIHFDGLAAFAGSAFVDIPKHWDTSSFNGPSTSYTISLVSPYAGNPVAQLLDVYIPLAMLICGVAPLATGKQSHVSPFLCELHDRGRCITRMGVITSLSITRGTSNTGFNNDSKALAIDVSFTITDLSSVLSIPIQPGFSVANSLDGLFDAENTFTDYLMTLAGVKLADTIYRIPMLRYNINREMAQLNSFFSTSHVASYISSLPGVNLISAAMRGTDRK